MDSHIWNYVYYIQHWEYDIYIDYDTNQKIGKITKVSRIWFSISSGYHISPLKNTFMVLFFQAPKQLKKHNRFWNVKLFFMRVTFLCLLFMLACYQR